MTTATPAHSKDPVSPATSAPDLDIDPDHDIDAKKTLIVLGVCSAFVFGSVFVLYLVFGLVIDAQRISKIEQAPTPQLDELRQWEAEQLQAGPKRKSIEDSIRELTAK